MIDSLIANKVTVDCQKDGSIPNFMEVSLYNGNSKSTHTFRSVLDSEMEPASKVYLEEWRDRGTTDQMENPEENWEVLLHELQILGNSAWPKFKENGEWGDWAETEIKKYFADVVDALRKARFPVMPPSKEDEEYNSSYWELYREAEQYIDRDPPSEDEVSDWEEWRDEHVSKQKDNDTVECEWVKIGPNGEAPYVLTDDAVEKEWLPPKGFSCLPENVEENVPSKYKYWKMSDREEAKKSRDELVSRFELSDLGVPGQKSCKNPIGSKIHPKLRAEFPKYFDNYVEWNPQSNSALWSAVDAEKFAVGSNVIEDLQNIDDKGVSRLKSRDWDNNARASAVKPSNVADRLWKFEVAEKHIGKDDLESCVEMASSIKSVEPDYSFDFSDGFHFFDDPDQGLIELKKMVAGLDGKIMISTPMDRPLESVFGDWNIVTLPSVNRKIVKNYDDNEDEEDTLSFDVKFVNKQEDERIVGGIVYESGVYDADGEWASKDTVREAMVYFMENGIDFSVDHDRMIDAQLLECFQAEENTMKGTGEVPEGAWYVSIRVNDDSAWQRVKSGDLKGFSWEGKVLRERNASIT